MGAVGDILGKPLTSRFTFVGVVGATRLRMLNHFKLRPPWPSVYTGRSCRFIVLISLHFPAHQHTLNTME